MNGSRSRRLASVLVTSAVLGAPSMGLAQSAGKKAAAPKSPGKSDLKPIDPTPQEMFARLFAVAPSGAVGVESIAYGAGTGTGRLTRAESLAASSDPAASSGGRRAAVGPRGFTPREARLVVKEHQLMDRQTALIARLNKLESTLTVRAVTTTTPLQKAEANVVKRLDANQTTIMTTLGKLGTLAPGSPAVQAEYMALSAQAQTLGTQAATLIHQAGFPVGGQFPATASR